jgi:hypothetical protein
VRGAARKGGPYRNRSILNRRVVGSGSGLNGVWKVTVEVLNQNPTGDQVVGYLVIV